MVKTMIKKRFVFLFVVLTLSMAISAQAVVYISTPQELYDIRNDMAGDYVLTADIDLTGFPWSAIGYRESGVDYIFTGTFDGDYHTISNLTASDTLETPIYKNCPVFGLAGAGTVFKNVGMINPTISGGDYIGALVGDLSGEMSNCFTSGGTITQSYSSANVGTLIGSLREGGSITNCYSETHMTFWEGGGGLWPEYKGGFMNVHPYNNTLCFVTNCYFAGTLENFSADPGNENGAPFTGYDSEGPVTMTSCYYDEDTTGVPDGTCADQPPGLPTTEMMKQVTYVDWDFGETWTMIPGQTRPKLAGFGLLGAGNPVPYGGIIATDTSELCWSPPEIKPDGLFPSTPITGDITYDVYFGTDPNGSLPPPYGLPNLVMGTSLTCVPIAPGTFETNNVYYWTVTCHTDDGEIPGLLWPLVTSRIGASSPYPEDGEPGAPRNAILSWTSGEGDEGELPLTHTLYMDPNATYVTERNSGLVDVYETLLQATVTYDPDPELEWGETYYWVIDEDYGGTIGIIEGDVWSFTVDPKLECGPLAADVTGDCLVTLEDLERLAQRWLKCLIINDNCPGGFN